MTRKTKTALITVCLLLTVTVVYALAAAGGASDPLASLSYLTGTFTDAVDQRVEEKLDASDQALLNGDAAPSDGGAATWMETRLKAGDALTGSTGTGVLLLAGGMQVTFNSGAVVDVTTGTIVTSGSALTASHRYLVAEETTAVFTVTSKTAVVDYQGPYAFSYSTNTDYNAIAVALKTMHLFQGSFTGYGDGYDLEVAPTRLQALIMFIRVLGEENDALAYTGSTDMQELMRRAAQPDEMHMTDIVSVYGQTESAPGSTMSACGDPLDLRCNTVGYAFPHIECKIIDPETGEEVPDGVNGEFCSRGYNTMKGYYKMPEATAATVDKEGWLHSGDLACRDENGCYRITGRLKDMIIRGGENIYPKEIEEFIYTHPAVKDVQVIGVPDKKYGEEAMACIILKEPGSVTVEEMLDYIKASMARHKVPKYIDFVDAFPMNAAGKILKYKMREEATERFGLEGAAGIDTAQTAEQMKR